MFNLGFSELVLIAIIALIFIGPKQLPEIARTLGRTLNELKRATEDFSQTISSPKSYSNHSKQADKLTEPNLSTINPGNSSKSHLAEKSEITTLNQNPAQTSAESAFSDQDSLAAKGNPKT